MDIYYSTGGKNLVGGGSDVWVNHWVDEIQPKLDRPSKLVIHQDNDVRKDLDEADRMFDMGFEPQVRNGGATLLSIYPQK